MKAQSHVPVLLKEVLENLSPCAHNTYIDATFGGGGYTRAILKQAFCQVIGIDRDPEAQERARSVVCEFPERFRFCLSPFSSIETLLKDVDFKGIVFDFGVSSFQLDEERRGFSFQKEGPLDMRMECKGLTAQEVVNSFSEKDLGQIIKHYGEERFAHRIAKAIVQSRPLYTTFDLAKVIHRVVPGHRTAIDPATKTFQALRIFVNDELKEIDTALWKIIQLVKGKELQDVRVVTVSFHSLEDSIVKNWIRKNQEKKSLSRPFDACASGVFFEPSRSADDYLNISSNVRLVPLVPKVIVPSREELDINPRSRSAKLRAVILNPTPQTMSILEDRLETQKGKEKKTQGDRK